MVCDGSSWTTSSEGLVPGVSGRFRYGALPVSRQHRYYGFAPRHLELRSDIAIGCCERKSTKSHGTPDPPLSTPPPPPKIGWSCCCLFAQQDPRRLHTCASAQVRQPPQNRAQTVPPRSRPRTTAGGDHPWRSARATRRAAAERSRPPGEQAARAAVAAPAPSRRGAAPRGKPGSEPTLTQSTACTTTGE